MGCHGDYVEPVLPRLPHRGAMCPEAVCLLKAWGVEWEGRGDEVRFGTHKRLILN